MDYDDSAEPVGFEPMSFRLDHLAEQLLYQLRQTSGLFT